MVYTVESDWNGWDGDTLIKLSNGTFWRQAEYVYEYRYAYRPTARFEGALLFVDGMSRGVRVRQVYPTEATVAGQWSGWDGKTEVELTNGQTWQQAEYHYEYRYSYRPDALIEDDKMHVTGMSKAVRVRRIR